MNTVPAEAECPCTRPLSWDRRPRFHRSTGRRLRSEMTGVLASQRRASGRHQSCSPLATVAGGRRPSLLAPGRAQGKARSATRPPSSRQSAGAAQLWLAAQLLDENPCRRPQLGSSILAPQGASAARVVATAITAHAERCRLLLQCSRVAARSQPPENSVRLRMRPSRPSVRWFSSRRRLLARSPRPGRARQRCERQPVLAKAWPDAQPSRGHSSKARVSASIPRASRPP